MKNRRKDQTKSQPEKWSGILLIVSLVFTIFACQNYTAADDKPLPTLLAKRGKLILDDDGSLDRGGKKLIALKDGIKLKTALG